MRRGLLPGLQLPVSGQQLVGMRVERSSGDVDTRYFHRDHLGSVAILTDESGVLCSFYCFSKSSNCLVRPAL
jgi:hypothetical protein